MTHKIMELVEKDSLKAEAPESPRNQPSDIANYSATANDLTSQLG